MVVKIKTYKYLEGNKIVYIRLNPKFKQFLKNEILHRYRSLNKFNDKTLRIPSATLSQDFSLKRYQNYKRFIDILRYLNIPKYFLYNNILSFFAKGSNTCKELILKKEIDIDEFFVEGFALYLAEGDNGSNGKTIPRKVRLVNSELVVHKHFINWLKTYFPNNDFYLKVTIPYPKMFYKSHKQTIINLLNLNENQLKINEYKWQRKTGFIYRTCLDNALLIDFILSIENKIKELCIKNKKLAAAYIRGMMIGEGTAYFNRSRYVRIEMRNENEIKYLYSLFKLLGYHCKPSLRSTRQDMWSLYIGAKQLDKFAKEIGFGIHEKRQKILEKGVNKILRVNQYC